VRRSSILRSLLLALAALLCSCLSNSDSEGGTEIPNGVRTVNGRLIDVHGNPVAGMTVRLIPADYVPSLVASKSAVITLDTTSTDGTFAIPVPDSGIFNLEGLKDTVGIRVDSVQIGSDTLDIELADQQVARLGRIQGISHMADQSETNQVRVTVFLPGTERLTKPSVGGAFSIDRVPAGRYRILFDPTLDAYDARILDTIVLPGQVLDLDTVLLEKTLPDTIDIPAGDVSGTWSSKRPYRVLGNIRVPSGQVLRMLPGTRVLMMDQARISVNGKLIIRGTADSVVTLSSGSILGLAGGTQDTISYAVFRNGFGGIYASNAAPYITHSLFIGTARGVVLVPESTGEWVVANNVFYGVPNPVVIEDGHTGYPPSVGRFLNNIVVGGTSVFKREYCPPMTGVRPTSLTVDRNLFGGTIADEVVDNYCAGSGSSAYTPIAVTNILRMSRAQADSQFVSVVPGNENFHLKSGAAARGAGINGTDLGIYSTYVPD
jgi:hypothetical protein